MLQSEVSWGVYFEGLDYSALLTDCATTNSKQMVATAIPVWSWSYTSLDCLTQHRISAKQHSPAAESTSTKEVKKLMHSTN